MPFMEWCETIQNHNIFYIKAFLLCFFKAILELSFFFVMYVFSCGYFFDTTILVVYIYEINNQKHFYA